MIESYQDTTGALMASGYDKLGTQEAMNDMYVVPKVYENHSQDSRYKDLGDVSETVSAKYDSHTVACHVRGHTRVYDPVLHG